MHGEVVRAPHTNQHTIFLSGPAGTGKTDLAVQRLRHLLELGIPAEQILVLVPQRTLATPYYELLRSPDLPAGAQVDVATIGGLARRSIDLLWPLVAEPAGFAQPTWRPRFLTLETAQYSMDRIVAPFLAAGAFDGITVPRSRLVSQIIDDLNKAAAVGFAADTIAARLKAAWGGESARLRIYDQVQAVAIAFRKACLAANLLDWSLQIEVFWQRLLPLPQLRRYLLSGYRHLIVDNTEEDIPVSHDLLRLWLPLCDSALLLHDADGGYRVFLGADPQGALKLASLCREQIVTDESCVNDPKMGDLGRALAAPFVLADRQTPEASRPSSWSVVAAPRPGAVRLSGRLVLPEEPLRFHPQMLDWVVDKISRLVLEEGLPAGEIAVLSPFLSDALRFSLTERLRPYDIPVRSHRPSRELREEPAARCLLTLARLAHPGWLRPPPAADVALAFCQAIADMDPVRARLMTDIVYSIHDGEPSLSAFHLIQPETQERISYLLGGRYDALRQWLADYARAATPADGLDRFFGRLFGEVLSQAGFGFHGDLDAGAVAASLIESVQKFRQSVGDGPDRVDADRPNVEGWTSLEYLDMVDRGVVAAQYLTTWGTGPEEALLLMPAYTFLMMNRPVTVQFWLDAGSLAWFERIYQPLTHPYVLRRDWPEGRVWADEDEVRAREQALARLILGLARRCRRQIYLAYSELNERGYEQQGPLLMAIQRLLRSQQSLTVEAGTKAQPASQGRGS